MVIQSKSKKIKYFFPSHLFIYFVDTYFSLVQLLLTAVKLNQISLPISIEYKMVRGLIKLCVEPNISK